MVADQTRHRNLCLCRPTGLAPALHRGVRPQMLALRSRTIRIERLFVSERLASRPRNSVCGKKGRSVDFTGGGMAQGRFFFKSRAAGLASDRESNNAELTW